jgi:chitinase
MKKLAIVLGTIISMIPFGSTYAQFKVVGYLYNWGNFVSDANSVDYTRVTHINIAFVNPNSTAVLSPTANLSSVVQIVHNNNAKVLVSLGGANAPSATWSALLQNSTTRTTLVNSIIQFVSTYNLDGVDIDIEGNLLDGTTITSAQYESFVTQLGTALHGQNKLMTAALATWFGSYVTNTAAAQFDWVNIMSYDNYGTWTGPGQHSSYPAAVSDLAYWQGKGLAKSKLVLGVPSYGYQWVNNTSSGSSSIQFNTLVGIYPRAANQDSIIPAAGQVIYYNGVPTIKNKTALAISSASGIMMWTLQFDLPTTNSNSLILAIDQVVKASFSNIPPTVTISGIPNNSTFTEGSNIPISALANDADGTVTGVSFFAVSTITTGVFQIGAFTNTPYAVNWNAAGPGTYSIYAAATDNAYATTNSNSITITVLPATLEAPFGGTAWPIPGKIEAENFDIGSNLGYYDLTPINQGGDYRTTAVDIEACSDVNGGYDVGWIQAGEWLKYTVNIAKDSTYILQARVASTSANNKFHVEIDGVNISGSIIVPNTGGWTTWATTTVTNIALTAGQHVMKVAMDGSNFNLNYVQFSYKPSGSLTVISNDNISLSNILIYPNPFQDAITIQGSLESAGNLEIKLLNVFGNEVLAETKNNVLQGFFSYQLSTSTLSPGIYLAKITNGSGSNSFKIVKE